MRRKDYENYVWYDVTEETYWVEEYPDEFPNCITLVYNPNYYGEPQNIRDSTFGWGTMVKQGEWKFIIIQKPEKNKDKNLEIIMKIEEKNG